MEDRFKPLLKTVKQHENQVSMLLGALVVIVAGILLLNIFNDGANGQSMVEAEPTMTQESTGTDTNKPEELSITLETEGIEEVLAEEPVETSTPSGQSVWEKAGKAILGILGIQKAAEVVIDEKQNTGNETSKLIEQADASRHQECVGGCRGDVRVEKEIDAGPGICLVFVGGILGIRIGVHDE